MKTQCSFVLQVRPGGVRGNGRVPRRGAWGRPHLCRPYENRRRSQHQNEQKRRPKHQQRNFDSPGFPLDSALGLL